MLVALACWFYIILADNTSVDVMCLDDIVRVFIDDSTYRRIHVDVEV
jgi:hypothetical protein